MIWTFSLDKNEIRFATQQFQIHCLPMFLNSSQGFSSSFVKKYDVIKLSSPKTALVFAELSSL